MDTISAVWSIVSGTAMDIPRPITIMKCTQYALNMIWRILVNWQEQQKTNQSKFPYLPIDVSCWLINQVQHTRVCGWVAITCILLLMYLVLYKVHGFPVLVFSLAVLLKGNVVPPKSKRVTLGQHEFCYLHFSEVNAYSFSKIRMCTSILKCCIKMQWKEVEVFISAQL